MATVLSRGVCVAFALRREALFFRRAFGPWQRLAADLWRARSHPSLLLLETGVGPLAMEKALDRLLTTPAPNASCHGLILSAGFSGALRPGLRAGDLVLATDVVDAEGGHWLVEMPTRDTGPGFERGRLLTVRALVADPREKRRLGALHRADVVDMETAALARACHGHGIPFGCLRAVSDEVDTRLSPRLPGLIQAGHVAPLRLAGALLCEPALVKDLWRLARQTRLAARQLGRGLGRLLQLEGIDRS